MSNNPYSSWSIEDIDEQIRHLRAEKEELQTAKRTTHIVRQPAYSMRNSTYPEEVLNLARNYGNMTRTSFFRQMRDYGIKQTEALQLVGAIQHPAYSPYSIERTEIEYEAGPTDAEIAEFDRRITEIDRQIELLQDAKREKEQTFTVYDITKYFTYDEPGGVHRNQSPRVRFEVRCQDATIRTSKELTDDFIEDKVEPIFDRAFEELGRNRVQRTEITMDRYRDIRRHGGGRATQVGNRYYTETAASGGHWINVESFRKEFSTRGFEPVGSTDHFNPNWNFRIVKYRLPGNSRAGEWSVSLHISEGQVR